MTRKRYQKKMYALATRLMKGNPEYGRTETLHPLPILKHGSS